VKSLDVLDSVRKKAPDPGPECVRDYTSENVVHRMEPRAVGTKAVSVPVRLIVATDGSVKHVHVIRASEAQRRNIEEALRQWKFKSYVKEGRPVEVETGMMFNLKPTNM
jgi:outer membrane biosynthesis protein TonB